MHKTEKRQRKRLMNRENGNRKRSTKRNTRRKIRGEGTSKKDNEDGKGEGLYCNVVGLRKKKEDFWDSVAQFEIVGLVETLVV
jgi:hypothetical protein